MKTNKTLVSNSDEPPTTSPETIIKYAESRVKTGETKLMQLKARELLGVYNRGVEDSYNKVLECMGEDAGRISHRIRALKKEVL
jgi:hypothetical protein